MMQSTQNAAILFGMVSSFLTEEESVSSPKYRAVESAYINLQRAIDKEIQSALDEKAMMPPMFLNDPAGTENA